MLCCQWVQQLRNAEQKCLCKELSLQHCIEFKVTGDYKINTLFLSHTTNSTPIFIQARNLHILPVEE
jgi:hypothetical protein